MKKIEDEFENPIDYLIINQLCEPISEYIHEYYPNVTPNMITFIGLICGLLSILCLFHNFYVFAFILFWIGYILDCLDGYYARKFKMQTKFGDYFDHIRDYIVNTLIVFVILSKLRKNEQFIFIFLFIIIFTGMNMHVACQNNETSILSGMSKICPEKEYLYILKHLGCGSYMLFISLSFLYL